VKAKSPEAQREEARRNTRSRFEQWAQNPSCEANTLSAVHNVRMADVAKHLELRPTFGQSPFAIAHGQDFEKMLFRRDGERLIEALIEAGVLPPGAEGLEDLRLRMNGGSRVLTIDQAIVQTQSLLRRIASFSPGSLDSALPVLIAGATVRIPKGVMLPEAILIIDALAVRVGRDRPTVIVGEIKTYPDRGGYTDPQELALARAQAGIYLHGLDLAVEELGISDSVQLSARGFLVLTKPGSNFPSVRANEDLPHQAERARRGFDLLERAAQALPGIGDPDRLVADEELLSALVASPTSYMEACLSFCDLAERCHKEAAARADPVILGEDVRRFVSGLPLDRVMELLGGEVPTNPTEEDVVRRVQEIEGAMPS
jgi:hypothetical protein